MSEPRAQRPAERGLLAKRAGRVGDRVSAVPSIPFHAKFRNVGGTVVLAGAERVIELTGSAVYIVERMNARRTTREIAADVAREFGIDEDTAVADVLEFIDDLAGDGLITWR